MEVESTDMGVSKGNLSSSLATSTSQQDTSMMNPENHNELKRKAGEMESSMADNSLKVNLNTNHQMGTPSPSPSSQRPLKKRLSLDLLSEASAMLAQGLGPSKIQEIVQQKESASACSTSNMPDLKAAAPATATNGMALVPPEKVANDAPTSSNPPSEAKAEESSATASNSMVADTKQMNGETTTSTQMPEENKAANDEQPTPKLSEAKASEESTATPNSMAVDPKPLNGGTTNTQEPQEKPTNDANKVQEDANGDITAAKQSVEAPAEQKEDPMQTETTPEETGTETPAAAPPMKMDAPVRTVSETDHSVKESQDVKIEDAKKVEPALQPEPAVDASNVEESKTSMPDEVKNDTPMESASETGIPADDEKKAEAIQPEPAKDASTAEESKAPISDESKKDIPMQSIPETNNPAKEPQETPVEDAKKEAPTQPAPEAEAAADKSTSAEVKQDSPKQEGSEQGNTVKESPLTEETKDTPMEAAPDSGATEVTGSQNAKAEEAPKETLMPTTAPTEPKAAPNNDDADKVSPMEAQATSEKPVEEGSQNATVEKDTPVPTSADATSDNSVTQKPLDSEMKTDAPAESAKPSDSVHKDVPVPPAAAEPAVVEKSPDVEMKMDGANDGSQTSDCTQNPATTEQKQKEGSTPTELRKEAKEESISVVPNGNVATEEAKQENGQEDLAAGGDKPQEVKEEKSEPMTTSNADKGTEESKSAPAADNVQVPVEEKGEAMNIDEPVEGSKEKKEEPVNTIETKLENGVSNVTEITEAMDTENQKMEIDQPAEDKKDETKEPISTQEPVAKAEEAKQETTSTEVAVKETTDTTDAPAISNEPSKEAKEDNGESMTADEPAKSMEVQTGESMAAEEAVMKTPAADPGLTSSENQNSTSQEEPVPTAAPTTSSETTVDTPNLNGQPADMDVDVTNAPETAAETETKAATDGEDVTPSDGQGAPDENKKVKKKHMDPQVLEIRKRIQFGCRDNDLPAAMKAYDEAIEKNIKVEAQSFYNLLNLCDGLERSVHIGSPKEKPTTSSNDEVPVVDEAARLAFAFKLRDHMKELNLPLNESAYSAIVKLLSKAKEYDKALEILEEAETVQQCKPKLRLYSSLLIAYCEACRMLDALVIWKKLTTKKLLATEKEYAALMQCATSTGDCIAIERVLTDLAEDVLVPSKATVGRILEWFELAHSFHTKPLTKRRADEAKVVEYLEDIHQYEKETPPRMGPVVNVNAWQISSACPIDTNTGVLQTGCLKGCKLNPVIISQRAWDEMRDMNEKIVMDGQVEGHKTQFQGGKKGKKRMDFSPQERRMEWDRFTKFLESIGQVDVVIDGANVGYYAKNFAGAPKHIDYQQIDWVVEHFRKLGKKVLLVLHERHFAHSLMPDNLRWLEQKWRNNKNLYKTPRGMNDDWFWLHVAYSQKSLVVSNDEMRDHHFQMLAPRTFLRWKERHHAHFDFGDWIAADDGRRQREVKFTFPEAYSRRIQRIEDGLVIPLAKRGDSNRFMDGAHSAGDDEPEEETYVCIRPNQPHQAAS